MTVLNIVLSVIDIILAIAIIVLFLVQEGNDRGIGVVAGGSSDSYYSKSKGRLSARELERRAYEWHDKGIVTYSAAAELADMMDKKAAERRRIMNVFGMGDRKPSETEEKYHSPEESWSEVHALLCLVVMLDIEAQSEKHGEDRVHLSCEKEEDGIPYSLIQGCPERTCRLREIIEV